MNTSRLFVDPHNNRISLAMLLEQNASSPTLASSDAVAPVRPDLTNVPEENKYKGCHYEIGVPEGGSCFTVLNAKPAWM